MSTAIRHRLHALRSRARAGGVLGLVALCAAVAAVDTHGATSTTVVGATVPSATSISTAGCATGTAGVTDFGIVTPGTSAITPLDCTVVFGSSNDTAMLRAYQSDAVGTAMNGTNTSQLDPTFDTDGRQTTPISAFVDRGQDLALQTDGKIVVAGEAGANFALARYNADGSLDTTFDTDGKLTTVFGAGTEAAYGVAIQSDGKIVAAGLGRVGGINVVAVARYNTNGSLDTTFDVDGMVTTQISASGSFANDLVIQPDGRILVVGGANMGSWDFALVRYNADGSLDTSFDTDGIRTTAFGGFSDTIEAVALEPDGRIVTAGYSTPNGIQMNGAVAVYNTDGSPYNAFDTDGRLTTTFGGITTQYFDVAIQPDGNIVVVGTGVVVASLDFAIARYTLTGALDPTFDTDGKQSHAWSANNDFAYGVDLQGDGKIVVAGWGNNTNDEFFAVNRYTTTGALDATFGTGGTTTANFNASTDKVFGMTLQSDEKIVVVGSTLTPSEDIAVARFGAPSIPDWAGSWAAGSLFGACLHTTANASSTWTLAGAGNCTTAINANWNALPITPSKVAYTTVSGTTNATANLRYGFKPSATQTPGTYVAPLVFETLAPNV